MASEPHPNRAPLWLWVLTLVLLATLVWLVGQRVQERPHVEVGVTGGEELPATPVPTATAGPVERAAGRGDSQAAEPREEASGGGGEDVAVPEVPTSPAPRR